MTRSAFRLLVWDTFDDWLCIRFAALFLATRAKLFLNASFFEMEGFVVGFVPVIRSVDPPVEGLARSIMSLGIGMVLLRRLTAVGTLLVRTFEVVWTTYFYY